MIPLVTASEAGKVHPEPGILYWDCRVELVRVYSHFGIALEHAAIKGDSPVQFDAYI